MGSNWGSIGKARGQIKDYSHDNLRKNAELKAALTGSTVRQKAKEERRLLYAPILKFAEGDGVGVDEVGDEWEPE